MPRDPDHRFANDSRESAALATLAMAGPDDELAREALAILHYRGTSLELEIARELATDADPARRALAADIMGQLGWDEETCLEESVDILLRLLDDSALGVVASAATNLGFRNHPRAIPRLLQHVAGSDADVRLGVVHGLSRHDDPGAVEGLIRLTVDEDRDVRDWATFGLGSLTDVDSPELREALLARVSEDDDEIRGEALIGLARRHHPDALRLVRDELNRPFAGDWPIEAAELLADTSVYPAIQAIWESLSPEDKTHFRRSFDAALDACKPKDEQWVKRRADSFRNESAARAMRAGADENLKQMARESRISAVGMTTDEELFEQSAITLTAVRLVAPHLTAGNHTTVLASAQHKSKPEIE